MPVMCVSSGISQLFHTGREQDNHYNIVLKEHYHPVRQPEREIRVHLNLQSSQERIISKFEIEHHANFKVIAVHNFE